MISAPQWTASLAALLIVLPSLQARPAQGGSSYNRWRPLDFRGGPMRIGHWWDLYNPHLLKGDYPLVSVGDEYIFIAATLVSDTTLVQRDGGLFQRDDRNAMLDTQTADHLATETLFARAELFWGDTVFQQRRLGFTVGQRYVSIADLGREQEFVDLEQRKIVRNVPDPEVFIHTFDERDGLQQIKIVDNDPNKNKSAVQNFVVDEAFVELLLWEGDRYYDFVSLFAGRLFIQTDRQGLIFANFANGGFINANLLRNRVQSQLGYAMLAADFNDLKFFNQDKPDFLGFYNLTIQDAIMPGLGIAINVQHLHTELKRDLDVTYAGVELFGHMGRVEIDAAYFYVMGTEDFFDRPKIDPKFVLRNGQLDEPASGQRDIFALDEDLKLSKKTVTIEERSRTQAITASLGFIELRYPFSWFVPRAAYAHASRDSKPRLEIRNLDGELQVVANIEDETQSGFDGVNPKIQKFGAGGSILLNERIDFDKNFFLFKSVEGNPDYRKDGLDLYNIGCDFKVTHRLVVALDINHLNGGFENSGSEAILTVNLRPFLNDVVVVTAAFAAARVEARETRNLDGTGRFDDRTLHRIVLLLRIVL